MRKENRLALTYDTKQTVITAVRGDSRFRDALDSLMEIGIYHSKTELIYDAIYLLARSYETDRDLPQPIKRIPRLELKGSVKEIAKLFI